MTVIVHFNYFWNFPVFFLARQPQGVFLHRFPPLKPCANENFPYLFVILRHWRDLDATLKHNRREKKKAFAQGFNGGKRSRRTP
jgi:hypothetical protein